MTESNTTILQENQQSRYSELEITAAQALASMAFYHSLQHTAADITTKDHEASHILSLPSSAEGDLELPVPPPDADNRTPAAIENAPDDAGLTEDEVVSTTKRKASGSKQPAKAQEAPKGKKPCAKTESARAKYDRIVALDCLAKRKCANCAKKRRGCDCYIDPEKLNSACAKCTLHKEGCSFVQDAAEPLDPAGIIHAPTSRELPKRRTPAGREETVEKPVKNAMGVAPSDSVPEEVQERIEQELARYKSAPDEQKPAAISASESRPDASRDEKTGLKRTPLPSSRPKLATAIGLAESPSDAPHDGKTSLKRTPLPTSRPKLATTSGGGEKRKPLPDGRPESSSKSTDDSKPEPTEDCDSVPKRETSPAKRRKLGPAAFQMTGANGDSVEDMKR
ncbi:hypothetical protein HYQ45_015300 [Verticillium longisporum]|uniref:Uncharacterized protein n=1 Tax=Verticillium longisporum TaxID=100787 RepID=A0A8I2Z8V5_VERLO|nr:hypothetical protein HYQ45_015300 [Verticillium longisporum]